MGAMMSVMLLIVFCICYCCHKRVQKSEYSSESTQQWLQASDDSDSTLQVFTLDSPQCYESAGVFVEIEPPPPSPPPSYEAVMGATEEKKEDPDLPTYETALTLGAHGYV